MVRAWRPAADEGLPSDADALRGVVEHVGSGTTMPFRDADQLVAFMLGGGAEDMPVEADSRASG